MQYQPPRVVLAAHVTFGAGGNAEKWQLEGWSPPDSDFTWSTGEYSRIRIPYQPGQGTLTLDLTLSPLLVPPIVRSQTLSIAVNGVELLTETLAGECAVSCPIPASVLGSEPYVDITLRHPQAFTPAQLGISADRRALGMAVREMLLLWMPPEPTFRPRRLPPLRVAATATLDDAVRGWTGLAPADLVTKFESVGHNCEFGLVQRRIGAEPLALLRFAGVGTQKLLTGLDNAFEGIEDADKMTVFTTTDEAAAEYCVREATYGIHFHTHINRTQATPDQVIQRMAMHLKFLRRKFVETLTEGHRILVLHHPACQSPAQVMPYLNILRSYGPNTLLYITAAPNVPPGTVEHIKPDLMHGFTDRVLSQDEIHSVNVVPWLNICANAYRLWRESGHGDE